MTSRAKIFDQYFTPPELAAKLIDAITVSPRSIADFAAGDGELLRAAENKWPGVKCIALDIDDEVLGKLKIAHPRWKAAHCDFTDSNARDQILVTGNKPIKLPAIVLNPPFSIRGGEIRLRTVSIGGIITRCSPALAFVVDAIGYLKKGGQLAAIVPHSITQSEKDATALKLLYQFYSLEIIEVISRERFFRCAPRTAIIRLTVGRKNVDDTIDEASADSLISYADEINVKVLRGSISNSKVVHSELQASHPFIHTTDLSKGSVPNTTKCVYGTNLTETTGPAVLLSRVGKPDAKKIVVLSQGISAVLSDCVISIECESDEHAERLRNRLIDNWLSLEETYAGTCARYISMSNLGLFLQRLGCHLHQSIQSLREKNLECVEVESL